jgi:hypothetical protein
MINQGERIKSEIRRTLYPNLHKKDEPCRERVCKRLRDRTYTNDRAIFWMPVVCLDGDGTETNEGDKS